MRRHVNDIASSTTDGRDRLSTKKCIRQRRNLHCRRVEFTRNDALLRTRMVATHMYNEGAGEDRDTRWLGGTWHSLSVHSVISAVHCTWEIQSILILIFLSACRVKTKRCSITHMHAEGAGRRQGYSVARWYLVLIFYINININFLVDGKVATLDARGRED